MATTSKISCSDVFSDEDKCSYIGLDEIEEDFYYSHESIQMLEHLSFDIIHKACRLSDLSYDGTGYMLSTVHEEVDEMIHDKRYNDLYLISECISKVLSSVDIDSDANDDSTEVILSLSYLHRNVIEFLENESLNK